MPAEYEAFRLTANSAVFQQQWNLTRLRTRSGIIWEIPLRPKLQSSKVHGHNAFLGVEEMSNMLRWNASSNLQPARG